MATEYQFLFSYFGEFGNPQAKVVAATGRNRKMTVQHTLGDPQKKQSFLFSIKAKFIKKPDRGELDIYIPPRPTLPIYLPRDVFYPFTLFSSASAPRYASSWALLWMLLALAVGQQLQAHV